MNTTDTPTRPKSARRSAARSSAAMPPFDDPERIDGPRDDQIIKILLDKLHDHPGNPPPTEPEIVSMMAWLSDEGQQEPITIRNLNEPIGHYQVLAGRTRLAAARRLGWDTLDARLRPELDDDAAAIRFAATNNTLRRSETALRQARWVAYLVSEGKSIEEAASIFGWSRSHATNMVGLLKLPEPWLGRVASGEMPPTVACRLNPYAKVPDLMKAFDKDYRRSVHIADRWKAKDCIGNQITHVLRECTRPMDKGVKHYYGYALGGDHPRYFGNDVSDEKKLRVVELPTGKNGAVQRAALNVKEYDRLNMPLIKKAIETRGTKSGKGKAKGKSNAASPAEQKAEDSRKRKEADKKLTEWITTQWRPAFLRLCASEAVRVLPPGEQWRYQALLPRLIEACGGGMGINLYQFEAVAAEAFASNDKHRSDMDRWRLEQTLATIREDDDPITDVEERQRRHVALLLWPRDERVAEHNWIKCITPDLPFGYRLPPLSIPAIEAIAKLVNIPINGIKQANVAHGWKLGAKARTQHRAMIQVFLERHTRTQLDVLAMELNAGCKTAIDKVDFSEAKTKAEQVGILLGHHLWLSPLPLPKCLEEVKADGKRRRTRRGE